MFENTGKNYWNYTKYDGAFNAVHSLIEELAVLANKLRLFWRTGGLPLKQFNL